MLEQRQRLLQHLHVLLQSFREHQRLLHIRREGYTTFTLTNKGAAPPAAPVAPAALPAAAAASPAPLPATSQMPVQPSAPIQVRYTCLGACYVKLQL
jgi:hypothetical protein